MHNVTFRTSNLMKDLSGKTDKPLHLILIATKPDIIKQIPLYKELKKRGHLVLLGHTGQHYDDNLSGGMLAEFGVEPDFNLGVRGSMHDVVSQIIARLGSILSELKSQGHTVIPYVHGDTTTAMAASNAAYCVGFSCVHVEAGIRTLTPDYDVWRGVRGKPAGSGDWQVGDIGAWREFLLERKNWKRGSQEPYPEQFNTRCSGAATGLHLAPVELDREFLLGEGYSEDRIAVVGNSVVDATDEAMKHIASSTVFEKYPLLQDGNFVRFCVHRRENCLSESRFRAIIDAMILLLKEGRTVLFIHMLQTQAAFQRFAMQGEITELQKTYPHFLCSPVWAEYTDVIAAMSKASVCATDSGSMQEEMNVLGVPCVTLRFGSDRSESVLAGGNLIAPPVDALSIAEIIRFAWEHEAMKKAPKLYDKNVSSRCIDVLEEVLKQGTLFRSDEERLGFAKTTKKK
jgi:UDP-N-acetylglucosamine 2-epimerase (non-hydrolysing)